jgi:hypothetical protein
MTLWRTQTVIALCQAMRQERNYSALPILADALQDADYPDESLLDQLRSGPREIDAERLVALIYSAKTAESVAWIEGFAAELGSPEQWGEPVGPAMTYSTLMEAASNFVEHDSRVDMGTNDNFQYMYEEFPEFWRHYETVTGKKPASATSFFACSC